MNTKFIFKWFGAFLACYLAVGATYLVICLVFSFPKPVTEMMSVFLSMPMSIVVWLILLVNGVRNND